MKNISLICVFLVFIEGVFGETVSVKEGDSPILDSGLPEIKTNDMIDWRFGTDQILIARVSKQNNPTTSDEALGGKFKGRLKLDGRTGNLTITNIKTTDSGDYEVTNSINTYKKTISIIVSGSGSVSGGLSPGAIAGIVIAVVAVVVGAVAGIYFGYVKNRQML